MRGGERWEEGSEGRREVGGNLGEKCLSRYDFLSSPGDGTCLLL